MKEATEVLWLLRLRITHYVSCWDASAIGGPAKSALTISEGGGYVNRQFG